MNMLGRTYSGYPRVNNLLLVFVLVLPIMLSNQYINIDCLHRGGRPLKCVFIFFFLFLFFFYFGEDEVGRGV